MNPQKTILRLLIVSQVFCLFFLMFMPTLIKILHEFWGKMFYTLLVLVSIGLALALRYAFIGLE